jgi:hypothetical protein
MKNHESKNQDTEFETTDISLASYLLTKGHKLRRVDNRAGRGFFIFAKKEVNHDYINYLNSMGLVEPATFLNQIRKLKAVI